MDKVLVSLEKNIKETLDSLSVELAARMDKLEKITETGTLDSILNQTEKMIKIIEVIRIVSLEIESLEDLKKNSKIRLPNGDYGITQNLLDEISLALILYVEVIADIDTDSGSVYTGPVLGLEQDGIRIRLSSGVPKVIFYHEIRSIITKVGESKFEKVRKYYSKRGD